MRMPTGGRLRTLVSACVLVVAASAVAVVAYQSRGFPVQDVTDNDGSVWVSNVGAGLVGRFNRPIEQLDSAVAASTVTQADFDVLQNGSTVLVRDRSAGKMRAVDVTTVTLSDASADIPASYQVVLGGPQVAVLDPKSGKLWVRPGGQAAALDLARDTPTAQVGADAAVTVADDGTVFAASAADDTLTTVPVSATVPGRAQRRSLGAEVSAVQISAVGDQPVVAADGGRLLLPTRQVTTLPGAPATVALQQPGPAADAVLVATDTALLAVPLDGGAVRVLSDAGTGQPANPVRLDGCVHAAWAGRPVYVRGCGDALPQARKLDGAPAGAALTFRVNRHVILLNEVTGGGLFLYEKPGDNLGDWNTVKPQDQNDKQVVTKPAQDDSRQNHPPVARADQYGVRAGQAVILPVLENDGDLDGDVIVIRSTSGIPDAFGTLATVASGQALQLSTTTAATGTVTFRYTIDDGRGGMASAEVTVTVHPPDQNSVPVAHTSGVSVSVLPGGSVSYNVLDDWRDPDGDPLTLVGAAAPGADTVRYTPGGRVTFTATGPAAGGRSVHVQLQISDGNAAPVTGELTVVVLPATAKAAPVARDDLVTAVAGQTVTISPLTNDSDPDAGAPNAPAAMRLTNVSPAPPGTTATPDFITNTVQFTARAAQTYYLTYQVTASSPAGSASAQARIRIDVRAPAADTSPVAVTDTAVLRGTAPTQVDVLANDLDADGDVLVVQQLAVPGDAGFSAAVVDHRWVRLVATTDHMRAGVLRYTLSDGVHTALGTVQVSQAPASVDQAPNAHDDQGSVRAGDILSLDVLTNDNDPDGDQLTLDTTVSAADDSTGHWYVDGGQVRFAAPTRGGTQATAVYTVRDPAGKPATAKITVNVVPLDPAHDQAPAPAPVQARVLAGTVTRIPLPLGGADPDGDSVVLLGAIGAPALGRIIATGPDYLDYAAYDGVAGTDTFSYAVMDPYGRSGTGQIRVGVAPHPQGDAAPLAADDAYTVAPGATVRIPVLGNDSDPDGDSLRLHALSASGAAQPGGAHLDGDRLVVTAGGHDGDIVSVQYTVDDGRGQAATATATVTSRTGADLAPVARDDQVTTFPAGAQAVDIDVLANDDDLDGALSDLAVTVLPGADPAASVAADRRLHIPLTSSARQVGYQITDRSGRTAAAFVHVPAAGNQAPTTLPAGELRITAGQSVTVEITHYAADPEGAPLRLTAADRVSSSPAQGVAVAAGSITRTSLVLHAAAGYHGPAMLAFEVSDGATPDQPGARTATIAVLVDVVAATPTPPTFTCSQVTPQAGGAAVTIDLAACVTGIDPQTRPSLSYSQPKGAPNGVSAHITDGILTVSANAQATGASGALTFTVSAAGAQTTATMRVTVAPAPLPRANDDTVTGVKAGTSRSVDVLANDTNPFPGQPLRVVDVATVSGSVTATIDADARHVNVTVAVGFHGNAVVAYRVQDATGQAARAAQGHILLAVLDRPAAPGTPQVRSTGDRTVVLSWAEPAGNGAPIDGYRVTAAGGFGQDCPAAVCTLTGLKNGQSYQFQVTARNAAGTSDPSPASAPAVPDTKPDQPAPPQATFGDGQITLAWTAPANRGSAIDHYEVEVSPQQGAVSFTGATSVVVTGLTNGASYTFRVRAVNRSNQTSDWSAFSAPQTPAGVPGRPDAPVANPVNDGIGQQMNVTWSEPLTNGAPISTYQLTVLRGGSAVQTLTVDGGQRQATVDVTNGLTYTYTLVAVNKAGPSPASAASAAAVAHGKPAQITGFSVSDHDSSNAGYDTRVAYSLTPPSDNGMAITAYQVSANGGGSWTSLGGASSGFITGLANGTSYQFVFRACNDQCGPASAASATVVPYGRPFAPIVSANQNGAQQINLNYAVPASNGRGPSYFEFNIDNSGWVAYGLGNGTITVGNGYSQTHTIQARLHDVAGQVSDVSTASATTQSPPPAVMTVSKGAPINIAQCSSSSCAWVHLRMTGFTPNTNYTVSCDSTATSGGNFPNFTARTDGSGTYNQDTIEFFGFPGQQVWCDTAGVESNHFTWS